MLESVHLEQWPVANELLINDELEAQMAVVRQVAEKTHAIRKDQKIKVRQPLLSLKVTAFTKLSTELLQLLGMEVNVESVTQTMGDEITVELDTQVTEELQAKGEMREVIRTIQDLRKEAGVAFDQLVTIQLPSWPKQFEEEIKKKTLVKELVKGGEAKLISE